MVVGLSQSTPMQGEKGDMYYGSQIENGVYVSAREVGNIFAGMVAAKFNKDISIAMMGYGALNQAHNKRLLGAFYLFTEHQTHQLMSKPFFGESFFSGSSIIDGYNNFVHYSDAFKY